jgi:competence protein ComEC
MLMVSFVAGAATGPFAIQHFNRVANYGVFANLTADFLASVVLMPALAISLQPGALGLGHSAWPVSIGSPAGPPRGVIAIGHLFATRRRAALTWPSAPEAALAISYLAIVFACLWRGRLRWIGAAAGGGGRPLAKADPAGRLDRRRRR